MASVAGQGRDVDLQDAYGKGEAGSSSEDEEEAVGGEGAEAGEGAAAGPGQQQQQQQERQKEGGGKTGRGRRGGGQHAAEFSPAEIERRQGLWEQRIARPETQVRPSLSVFAVRALAVGSPQACLALCGIHFLVVSLHAAAP